MLFISCAVLLYLHVDEMHFVILNNFHVKCEKQQPLYVNRVNKWKELSKLVNAQKAYIIWIKEDVPTTEWVPIVIIGYLIRTRIAAKKKKWSENRRECKHTWCFCVCHFYLSPSCFSNTISWYQLSYCHILTWQIRQ